MKNKFAALMAFVTVFSVAYLTADIVNKKVLKPFNEIIKITTSQNEYDEVTCKYRISVFDGKLAVFEGESKLPYKVYETYINSLPQEDIKILEEGIRVDSSKELMKIIEEYTS